jgi:hypothetical protein
LTVAKWWIVEAVRINGSTMCRLQPIGGQGMSADHATGEYGEQGSCFPEQSKETRRG